MTRFPLRRLRLRPGEEHREALTIELEPFELGGQRYLPVPQEVPAELAIAQATSGLVLRLAFGVRLHGPCMELEDQFGIKISDEDAQKIQTVGQAVDYVSSHQ